MRPTGLSLPILLVAAAQLAAASHLWPIGKRVASEDRKRVIPDDLTSLITVPCGAKSKEHVKAMELLDSLRSAPTCNKLATSNLLSSCQSIEGSSAGQGSSLEGVKATYAAQLALCELRNVGAEPPEQCRSMTFDTGTPVLDLHSAELRGCLRSLESRPQWWTSYSNNIQNAVVMCRAARAEIEKDDMINTMKTMLSTSSTVDEKLDKVLRMAREEMERQRSFAAAMHEFQAQIVHDLETASLKGQNYISKLTAALGSSLLSLLRTGEDIQISVNDLSRSLKSSSDDAGNINTSVTQIFQRILHGSSELAVLRNNELQRSKELSSDLQQSLQTMRYKEVAGISDFLGKLHNDLRLSQELLANNTIILKDNMSLSQAFKSPTYIVNSASQWSWLILTTFALWIYNTRAGALLTIITIGFIKLVDLISPDQCDIIILQLTREFSITLIGFFQGLGIMIALALPFARVCGFMKQGPNEQQEFCCSRCGGTLRASISEKQLNPA